MLRPERMSRVSIAGAEPYLETVIETLHDLNLLHVSDYDGSWEGFDNGAPLEGGEGVSEKLLQVRAIESKLDLEADTVDEVDAAFDLEQEREEIYGRLDDVRETVNELDDRRAELEDELRTTRERRRELEPFMRLGVPLDLLRGYSSVELKVGRTTDRDNVVEALEDASSVEEYEVIGEDVVAVVARTEDGGLGDALAGVDFAEIEVPEEDGDPQELYEELEARAEELEDEVADVQDELDEVSAEHGDFLLALEEALSIEAEKSELPLQFAATENSFYAEGWIPTEQVDEVEEALSAAVGEHLEFQELETAEYDRHGHPVDSQGDEGEADEGEEHEAVEDPPVKQDNPGPAKPFELLVNTVNRPKYTELDPTLVVFLTFPFAFGFMIGDMGYGVFYMLMGAAIYRFVDNDALKALGVIGIWAGFFTVVFGYLYGDAFGVHISDLGIHPPMSSVISKGIQAADIAQTWLVASILFGLVHLNTAYVYGFFNHFRHDLKDAVLEYVSWMLIIDGFFLWVFSLHGAGLKPAFLVGETSVLYENGMFALGFQGLPASVGLGAVGLAVVGMVMMVYEEGVVGAIEMPAHAFGHVLSYLRIMAVLLAKGGMAFVVNLLVFGAYEHEGVIHFGLHESPAHAVAAGHAESVAFPGLVWLGLDGGGAVLAVAAAAAVLVFALGHVLVLLLGITAAGIQMVRLEYVEFFGKFYEGGGRAFEPFGRERKYTEEGG